MIALVGDAELDEGNIFEALLEGWKQGLRNCWWIIDYNRQSLDAVVREGLWERFEALFRNFGWDVVILKYGALLAGGLRRARRRSAARTGSTLARTSSIRRWCSRAARPGASGCIDDIGDQGDVTRADRDAAATTNWRALMTNLGGHDLPSLTARRFAPSTTTGRPASSATPSRASACRSPATRTTTPG